MKAKFSGKIKDETTPLHIKKEKVIVDSDEVVLDFDGKLQDIEKLLEYIGASVELNEYKSVKIEIG